MSVTTYEAIVKNGHIELSENVSLPENAKVYVVIPGIQNKELIHLRSPRLVNPIDVDVFRKELLTGNNNADS